MATKNIAWNDGSGDYITLTYDGQGNGTVAVTSQPNNSANVRSATFDIKTTAGSPVVTRELTVTQGACPVPIGTVLNYAYTGSYQEVTLPAGRYKLQCWGAQGGSLGGTYGGKGGYSTGILNLTTKTTLYIYVGGSGTNVTKGGKDGGFNGGGGCYTSSRGYANGSGGGASDVRIGQKSLYARVIVAGGGGGAAKYDNNNLHEGGAGGGTSGMASGYLGSTYKSGRGGTQTSRGISYYKDYADLDTYGNLADFGKGAGAIYGENKLITGGGGGWYGGGYGYRTPGGGGSGYVYTVDTASNYPSGCLLDSSHYLADANSIDGLVSMPSTSGGTETGHSGDGYIRITRLD